MRQFSLKNSIGEVYRLNDLDYFLHDPEGLGFRRNTKFQKIGSNYEILQDSFEQQPISASIMFKSSQTISAYRQYSKFREFLQLIPLTLIYRIPGGEFLLDVIPESVEKTEINSTLGMDVGITLTPLTMWYRDISASKSGRSVGLNTDSNILSPCHIMITPSSASTSITWGIYDDSSELVIPYATGTLTGIPDAKKIATTDTLHIRTDTNPYQLYKTSSGGTKSDLYEYSDFSTKRFFMLKKGYNGIMCNTAASISVEARIYYETV